MKKLLATGVIAVLFSSCGTEQTTNNVAATGAVTDSEIGKVVKVQPIGSQDARKLLAKQQDIVILDVRTPQEYNSGHLTNAQHIDFFAPDFAQQLTSLDTSKPYLVYCAVGGRSREAVRVMQELGFSVVYDATEGYAALQRAGIAVEQ